jgi:hypothetical protein
MNRPMLLAVALAATSLYLVGTPSAAHAQQQGSSVQAAPAILSRILGEAPSGEPSRAKRDDQKPGNKGPYQLTGYGYGYGGYGLYRPWLYRPSYYNRYGYSPYYGASYYGYGGSPYGMGNGFYPFSFRGSYPYAFNYSFRPYYSSFGYPYSGSYLSPGFSAFNYPYNFYGWGGYGYGAMGLSPWGLANLWNNGVVYPPAGYAGCYYW